MISMSYLKVGNRIIRNAPRRATPFNANGYCATITLVYEAAPEDIRFEVEWDDLAPCFSTTNYGVLDYWNPAP